VTCSKMEDKLYPDSILHTQQINWKYESGKIIVTRSMICLPEFSEANLKVIFKLFFLRIKVKFLGSYSLKVNTEFANTF
jgi:hypothetical protein